MGTPVPRFKIGIISAAHGVRGQVKIHSFSEDPEDLLRYGILYDSQGKRSFELTRHGIKGTQLIASIKGIDDRNDAEKLKNTELYADESLQPIAENQWAYADLTGLEARTISGEPYGRVLNIMNYGASDIIELELPNGTTELLPFTDGFFGDIEAEKGYLIVFPPDYAEPETEAPENE